MPWKPKCCQSKIAKTINDLKFNRPIQIQYQSKQLIDGEIGKSKIVVQDIFSTFADVKTKGTQSFFNQINTSPAITHIFNIRYTQTFYIALSKIKQEYWLVSNGQRFAIERIENVNEENLILRFYCNIKGEDSVEYSKAR